MKISTSSQASRNGSISYERCEYYRQTDNGCNIFQGQCTLRGDRDLCKLLEYTQNRLYYGKVKQERSAI